MVDNEAPKSPERRRIEHLAADYLGHDHERRARRRHHDGYYEVHESIERLRRANEVLEFLDATRRDPYATLADIEAVLVDAREGISYARRVLVDTGFMAMLDEHFDTVIEGLDADGLPDDEVAVLSVLGFPALAATVHADIDLLAAEWRRGIASGVAVAREFRRAPASAAFDQAIDRIEKHRVEYTEYNTAVGESTAAKSRTPTAAPTPPRKQRRWWKGIGQVVEGAAIAVVDAGMAVGAFKFPVSPELQTYGAVVSVAGGVGKMMNGVGELRGE